MKKWFYSLLFFVFCVFVCADAFAQDERIANQRMALYKKYEVLSHIPWFYFAAIDQFERNIHPSFSKHHPVIGITFTNEEWIGAVREQAEEVNPSMIRLFGGIGLDGDGDGLASINSDEDRLYVMTHHLMQYGFSRDDIKQALWDYYRKDKAVSIIMSLAKVYETFGHTHLTDRAFPLPPRVNYSYKSTWGAKRSWGGRRIHEGTDIFANYGVPVRATNYGVVEVKGWNRYGGWRIGIRDINNVYHYYAHLNGFEKGIQKGKVVKPGDVIGYVGSSGYGPPGTQGKFPPHLHYGMYKYNGKTEWSFDPYPSLRIYERLSRKK